MLVGRDRELSELAAALERLPSGLGALFLLAGEPGIGKTRLAVEAAELARGRGVTAVWGRCWESGGAPAFWPWREVFEALGLPFPEGAAIAANSPEEARFALFREVLGALGRAAARAPVLVVLEDLHAADPSTLLLLEFIAGRVSVVPLVLVGTYRELEARRRDDAGSIARIGRAGRTLELPRLTPADVAVLVRGAIEGAGERLAATVFDTTQGNPLFVGEVVRDLRVYGERSELPLGVREVIRQRLALLSPEVRLVLEACAVLGVELAVADVVRMMPQGEAALEEATSGGVLVRRRARARFSHALYREALYGELAPARRQELHREAARSLAAAGAPLAELAHHLLEAGPGALPDAVEHAIRAAGHAVGAFAFEDAVAILERARAAVPPGAATAALRCRLLIALGETKILSGDGGGRDLCVEAAEAARALGDAVLLAQAGLAYGSVFLMGGVDPILVTMLEQALAGLPEVDGALRARVMARLAAARQPSPPAARARDIELGLAAIEMARRVADRRELLGVLQSASGVLYGAVDPAVRLPIAREQEALARELGDTTRLLHARVRLALDHLELGDYAAYAELATTYEEHAARLGPEAAPWRVPLMRSMLALSRDDFAGSERFQAEARRLGGEQPRARRALAFHRLGYLRAAERHAELRAAIPELRGLWLAMPYGAALADARVASVLARIGADEDLRALLSGLPADVLDEEINCAALADVAWATADAALAARLEPLLAPYRDRWQFYWFDCEIVDAPNTRALAYLAAILGRAEEAEQRFARALGAVEATGRRSLAARMRFELGDLLLRLGRDTTRARELVAAGRSEASAHGLTELVGLIDRRHPDAREALVEPTKPAARTARPPSFTMRLEGEYYALTGTQGPLRFKANRGMRYLATLVERPNVHVHVLELAGSSDHPDRGDAGEVADATTLAACRARLDVLRDAAESAEALGNAEAAERARGEMEAIAAELVRMTRKGGRARRGESAVDRARSAVQRRIKDALDRIAERDAPLGRWLRRSVRTGNYCLFSPDG